MVLELYVWGPAFGLPSIDAECIAAIACLNRIVPRTQWTLIADHDTSISPRNEFPVLVDGRVRATGLLDIVAHLRNHSSEAVALDDHLSHQQCTDRTAFLSFLQSTARTLVDLSLFISSENYNTSTSSAYTAILPWYLNYTIPPNRRDLARSRTAHLGLSSLDVSTAEQERGLEPGSLSLASDFKAAKRDAGIPTADRPSKPTGLSMGRGKGVQGLLSSPVYAARFKLDVLTNELLEPLSDLLGEKVYLLDSDKPSSLDCLAFGYLALLFYPSVPQAWVKETMRTKFPRVVSYIERMRQELLEAEESLPWRPTRGHSLSHTFATTAREWAINFPLLSNLIRTGAVIQLNDSRKMSTSVHSELPSPLIVNTLIALSVAATATVAGFAIRHRMSPREGDLIFWALRSRQGFGEAGNILSVFANHLPRS